MERKRKGKERPILSQVEQGSSVEFERLGRPHMVTVRYPSVQALSLIVGAPAQS